MTKPVNPDWYKPQDINGQNCFRQTTLIIGREDVKTELGRISVENNYERYYTHILQTRQQEIRINAGY